MISECRDVSLTAMFSLTAIGLYYLPDFLMMVIKIDHKLLNNLYITKYLSLCWETCLLSFPSHLFSPPFSPKYINFVHLWWSLLIAWRQSNLPGEFWFTIWYIFMSLSLRSAIHYLCGQTSLALIPKTSSYWGRIREWNMQEEFSTVPGT